MKFKVGDKVKHEDFGEGVVVEINSGSEKNSYLVQFKSQKGKLHNGNGISNRTYKDEDVWFFLKNKTELKLIKPKQFTKSDLKDGDIVTYRNGEQRIVNANKKRIVYINNWESLSFEFDDFNNDLTNKYVSKYDVIKVERLVQYETVFERKEEILDKAEKRYLRNVIRPFRDKVIEIIKVKDYYQEQYIIIAIKGGRNLKFPNFEENTKYKNMELDKPYTLSELRTIKE